MSRRGLRALGRCGRVVRRRRADPDADAAVARRAAPRAVVDLDRGHRPRPGAGLEALRRRDRVGHRARTPPAPARRRPRRPDRRADLGRRPDLRPRLPPASRAGVEPRGDAGAAAQMALRPFDRSRPLWEGVLFEGVRRRRGVRPQDPPRARRPARHGAAAVDAPVGQAGAHRAQAAGRGAAAPAAPTRSTSPWPGCAPTSRRCPRRRWRRRAASGSPRPGRRPSSRRRCATAPRSAGCSPRPLAVARAVAAHREAVDVPHPRRAARAAAHRRPPGRRDPRRRRGRAGARRPAPLPRAAGQHPGRDPGRRTRLARPRRRPRQPLRRRDDLRTARRSRTRSTGSPPCAARCCRCTPSARWRCSTRRRR